MGYLCEGGVNCIHGADSTHWVEEFPPIEFEATTLSPQSPMFAPGDQVFCPNCGAPVAFCDRCGELGVSEAGMASWK